MDEPKDNLDSLDTGIHHQSADDGYQPPYSFDDAWEGLNCSALFYSSALVNNPQNWRLRRYEVIKPIDENSYRAEVRYTFQINKKLISDFLKDLGFAFGVDLSVDSGSYIDSVENGINDEETRAEHDLESALVRSYLPIMFSSLNSRDSIRLFIPIAVLSEHLIDFKVLDDKGNLVPTLNRYWSADISANLILDHLMGALFDESVVLAEELRANNDNRISDLAWALAFINNSVTEERFRNDMRKYDGVYSLDGNIAWLKGEVLAFKEFDKASDIDTIIHDNRERIKGILKGLEAICTSPKAIKNDALGINSMNAMINPLISIRPFFKKYIWNHRLNAPNAGVKPLSIEMQLQRFFEAAEFLLKVHAHNMSNIVSRSDAEYFYDAWGNFSRWTAFVDMQVPLGRHFAITIKQYIPYSEDPKFRARIHEGLTIHGQALPPLDQFFIHHRELILMPIRPLQDILVKLRNFYLSFIKHSDKRLFREKRGFLYVLTFGDAQTTHFEIQNEDAELTFEPNASFVRSPFRNYWDPSIKLLAQRTPLRWFFTYKKLPAYAIFGRANDSNKGTQHFYTTKTNEEIQAYSGNPDTLERIPGDDWRLVLKPKVDSPIIHAYRLIALVALIGGIALLIFAVKFPIADKDSALWQLARFYLATVLGVITLFTVQRHRNRFVRQETLKYRRIIQTSLAISGLSLAFPIANIVERNHLIKDMVIWPGFKVNPWPTIYGLVDWFRGILSTLLSLNSVYIAVITIVVLSFLTLLLYSILIAAFALSGLKKPVDR